MVAVSRDPVPRFWSRVAKTDGCWLWTGAKNGAGYGQISIEGRSTLVHRFSFEMHVGPIQQGMVLDHLCRTPACVNPAHLEEVTVKENTDRGAALITHCPQGHAYTPENTRLRKNGHRGCRQCHRDCEKRRRERKAA